MPKTPEEKRKHSEYKKRKRKELQDLKRPCERCGFFHVAAMHWHHPDPTVKEESVNKIIRNKGFKAAVAEIEKCICLCANCHLILHHELDQ